MSSHSSPLLRLEVKPSRLRRTLTVLALLVATLWPWTVTLWTKPVALLLSSLLMGGIACWLRYATHPSRHLMQIIWQSSGNWLLYTADGVEHSAELDNDSWITRNLLILRWRCGKQRLSFTIMRPELDARQWRLWQTRLRLEAGHRAVREQLTS